MQPIDLVKSHAAGGRIPQARYKVMYGLAAIVVAACAATAWSFRSSPWMQDPTDLNARLDYVRSNTNPGNGPVDLLVLGSSRPAFGINSHDLAQATGLRRDAAQNIAFPGFRPEAIMRQIEAAPQNIMQAKKWIVGIDDYYLLQEHAPALDQPLLERAEAGMASWLTPVMKLNSMGRELERNIAMVFGWKPRQSLDHWTMGANGSWHEPRLSTRVVDIESERAVFQAIIDSYFKFANDINPQAVRDLETIIDVAKRQGIKIVLVSMPHHSGYDSMALSAYPDIFLRTIKEVERIAEKSGIPFIDCRRSVQNCGVADEDFADPVHLNDAGAAKMTSYLAEHMP